MDNDVVCNICQTEMPCINFIQGTTEDSDIGDIAFRLKCGHAFHTTCIVRSLRLTSACPMCRNAPVEGQDSIGELVYANGEVRFILNETYEYEDTDIPEPEFGDIAHQHEIQTQMTSARQDSRVQRARACVNRARKMYRIQEASIMRLRRNLVSQALGRLRIQCQARFQQARRTLERSLARLKSTETEVAGRQYVSTRDYSIDAHVGNQDEFGPLKHKFWYH